MYSETDLYDPKTIRELEAEYPQIPWLDYLNNIVAPDVHLELTEEVMLETPSFFKSFFDLLSETSNTVLANYIFWRVTMKSALYTSSEMRTLTWNFNAALTGETMVNPRWQDCIIRVQKLFDIAAGGLYVRKLFDGTTKQSAMEIFDNIRGSFRAMHDKVRSVAENFT